MPGALLLQSCCPQALPLPPGHAQPLCASSPGSPGQACVAAIHHSSVGRSHRPFPRKLLERKWTKREARATALHRGAQSPQFPAACPGHPAVPTFAPELGALVGRRHVWPTRPSEVRLWWSPEHALSRRSTGLGHVTEATAQTWDTQQAPAGSGGLRRPCWQVPTAARRPQELRCPPRLCRQGGLGPRLLLNAAPARIAPGSPGCPGGRRSRDSLAWIRRAAPPQVLCDSLLSDFQEAEAYSRSRGVGKSQDRSRKVASETQGAPGPLDRSLWPGPTSRCWEVASVVFLGRVVVPGCGSVEFLAVFSVFR